MSRKNVYKCDRCGEEISDYKAIHGWKIRNYLGNAFITIPFHEYDLCRNCQDELTDWFYKREKHDNILL